MLSPAATAVCTSDPRSVIVPRRPNQMLVEHARFINNAKYSRLVESRRFAPVTRRSATVPSLTRDQDHVEGHKKASQVASSDHVFQVSFRSLLADVPCYM
ncbi:unnamed protein product [Ilex paraguariensis]|uniref:Uncharacterized protein n=1 Tax=Ilex paraguariensis TaxID=185542 RepID=A0ABC8STH8_9AQUA